MLKKQFALIIILVLMVGCSGSKNLQEEIAQVKEDSHGTDSTLFMLDVRLKEFSKEVKAMRETYKENHISLENLYKSNAESKRSIEQLTKDLDGKIADERSYSDSVSSLSSQNTEQVIAGIQAEQEGMQASLTGLNSSIETTQFQVDSIFAVIDPEKMNILEENLLNIQSTFSFLDSSFSEYQLSVTDHIMGSDDQIATLERHAGVQDSANYDILSQLVLLENKIISLTNSFNELMAMPGSSPVSTNSPVNNERPLQQVKQVAVQSTSTARMDYETYKQYYIDALSSYQNGDYMGAIDDFNLLLQNDSQNDLADNAQYWIGECYYALDEYGSAISAFQKVINYQDSNKADAAQFKIGYSYLNSGDKARAYSELERLLDLFPESSYQDKVKQILASR